MILGYLICDTVVTLLILMYSFCLSGLQVVGGVRIYRKHHSNYTDDFVYSFILIGVSLCTIYNLMIFALYSTLFVIYQKVSSILNRIGLMLYRIPSFVLYKISFFWLFCSHDYTFTPYVNRPCNGGVYHTFTLCKLLTLSNCNHLHFTWCNAYEYGLLK